MESKNISTINSLTLIAELRKHPVLYDQRCTNKSSSTNQVKNDAWNAVCAKVYPNYNEIDETTKLVMQKTLQKRWKSLRDSFVKAHRLRTENPNKLIKSPTVQQLEFLIPFIKSRSANSIDGKHSPDFLKLVSDVNGDTIDLISNEGYESEDSYEVNIVKSVAIHQPVHEWQDNSNISHKEPFRNHFHNTQLNSSAAKHHENMEEDMKRNFPIRNIEEKYEIPNVETKENKEKIRRKFNELMDLYKEDSQDVDRTFLLSLLPAFKTLSSQNKLKVKVKFLHALCEASN